MCAYLYVEAKQSKEKTKKKTHKNEDPYTSELCSTQYTSALTEADTVIFVVHYRYIAICKRTLFQSRESLQPK